MPISEKEDQIKQEFRDHHRDSHASAQVTGKTIEGRTDTGKEARSAFLILEGRIAEESSH